MTHNVKWIDRGVWPTQKPDRKYPNGIDVDMSHGQNISCVVMLPYPAPRCGYYRVTCETCNLSVVLTVAGRRDDPRSVRLPCGGFGDKSRLQ